MLPVLSDVVSTRAGYYDNLQIVDRNIEATIRVTGNCEAVTRHGCAHFHNATRNGCRGVSRAVTCRIGSSVIGAKESIERVTRTVNYGIDQNRDEITKLTSQFEQF